MSRSTSHAAVLEQTPMPLIGDVTFAQLTIDNVRPSRTNPRGKHEREALSELTASIAKQGVLMPVLVRPLEGDLYELVAGHRRFAAAKAAGLGTIPATVRELTDVEVLEIQVVENLQRADLTPLEEAEGYRRLLRAPGYDVAKIAERVGRSVKYVYDRMKLLALSKDAQALLLEEKITAGHAILLARLSHADQVRAMAEGALLEREKTLFDPDDEGASRGQLKARSVREFAGWIDTNVRFDAERVDAMLFPETAAAIGDAPKVVAITHLNYVPEEARDGKTIGPRSWKRADGQGKSKTCEFSTLGYVAVGPHRGEAFDVCVNKDRCTTHWAEQVRAKKKAAAARASAPSAKAGAKAESPETAARRQALEQAIRNSEKAAVVAFEKAVGDAAALLAPEDFIRKLAEANGGKIGRCARLAGEKLAAGSAPAVNWIRRAPIAQLQRFFLTSELDYRDDIGEVFGVDRAAIFAEHANAAREAVKVQTSAQPKAGKVAKPRKAKA